MEWNFFRTMTENFVDNPQIISKQQQQQQQSEKTGSAEMKYPLRTKVDAQKRLDEEDFPKTEMNLSRAAPLIRIAMPNDAKDLEKLAESVSLTKLPSTEDKDLAKTGFLVSGFDSQAYAKFIKNAEHFLVLHVGSDLVGFLLAYGSEHIEPEKEELNMHIKTDVCCDKKFVLVKQICISPKVEYRGQGYATMLYKELYARVSHYYDHEPDRRPIYAAIVKIPANPVSMKFHEKVHFKKITEFTPEADGMPRYIYENKDPMKSLDDLTTKKSESSEQCLFTTVGPWRIHIALE